MTSQRVIVVEGFLDRAFLAGFLKRSKCTPLGAHGAPPPKDPWGAKVAGGQYAYQSPTGVFVRVVHSNGDGGIDRNVQLYAKDAITKPIDLLLAVVDPDVVAQADWLGPVKSKVRTLAAKCSGSVDSQNPRAFVVPGVGHAELGVWATDEVDPQLPQKQTLERLVVAAIADAEPARFAHVVKFLNSRPAPPPAQGKEEAMALMAGWFSWRLSEGFFEAVWEESAVAAALEARLLKSGLLPALQMLAR
ncbi:MAG: hypothetical protein ABTQ32_36230 [Myxococcaceae bacterium]